MEKKEKIELERKQQVFDITYDGIITQIAEAYRDYDYYAAYANAASDKIDELVSHLSEHENTSDIILAVASKIKELRGLR